jgi:methyl-accepting chemotaxis protein
MKLSKFFKFNLSIGKKILTSFLFLIAVIIVNGILTYTTLNNSMGVLGKISEEIDPTLETLTDFRELVKDSKTYSANWIYIRNYERDKEALRNIHGTSYPEQKKKLSEMTNSVLTEEEQIKMNELIEQFEILLQDQMTVMESLNSAMAYEDPMIVFVVEDLMENTIIPQSDQLIGELNQLIQTRETQSSGIKAGMIDSFETLRLTIILLGVIGALFAAIISFILSRNITAPLQKLYEKISQISQGIIPEVSEIRNKDEIGEMSKGINSLISGFKSTSEFAREIGKGNLNAQFNALSDEDVLGQSLLSMRDNLRTVLEETNHVVKMAGEEGDLKIRIESEGKEGAWSELAQAVNHLLNSIATPILEVNKMVNALAEGDLSYRYDSNSKGDLRELVMNLNKASDRLNELLHHITQNANIVDESATEMLSASQEMNVNTGEIASAIAQMSTGAQNQVVKVDEASSFVEATLGSSKVMGEKAETINNAAKSGVSSSQKGKEMTANTLVISLDRSVRT